MQSSRPPLRPKPLNWSPSSHLTVFVRNLKLLQLDSQEDWPHITISSLSPSSQNQRQRIKAIEWALYHLFAIWDPAVTQDKLRPFFPPLEPLQSVNLRAAFFRVFSELKKNGDLGRETILRKSMLDDCKGDRFDELLAVFSTAVLRRDLTPKSDLLPNPAIRLATAKGITPEDYQLMLPLIIANNVSLGSMGERRARVQLTYDKFTQLLDSKKDQLANQTKNAPTTPEEPADFDSISEVVRSNWLGCEDWAETLLYGGCRNSSDAFLELPFSEAWSKANESTVDDLRSGTVNDLLIDLESRVSQQRDQLQRWREFSASIQKTEDPKHQASTGTSSIPLVFREHQALNIASISQAVRQSVSRTSLKEEDQRLLSSMNEEIARINGKVNSPRNATLPPRSPAMGSNTQINTDAVGSTRSQPSPTPDEDNSKPVAEATSESASSHQLDTETRSPVYDSPSEPEAERAFEHSRPNSFTLVERTRKSMCLVPPLPTSRSRESLGPRKPRASFPVNQFETPQKRDASRHISRASTPQDDLFNDDAEYQSVFKSRPRVAHSPIASPAVHFSPMDDFDLNVGVDIDHSPSTRRRL